MIKRLIASAAAALGLAALIGVAAQHDVHGQARPTTTGPWVPMGYNGLIKGACGVTSGGLTISGSAGDQTVSDSNPGSPGAIYSVGPAYPGAYYVEITRTAGTPAGGFTMDSGGGICKNIATVTNISNHWTNGVGWGFNGLVDVNGGSVDSLTGSITVGQTVGIAVDTRNTVPGTASTRGHFYKQLTGSDQFINRNPSFAPSYGTNTGGYSFAAMMPYNPPQAWDFDVYFAASKTEGFTVNSGGAAFVFAVPPGYAPGWAKQVPNALTYLGWNRSVGDSNTSAWGPADVGASGQRGQRSTTSHSASGKVYLEFTVSQLVDNGTYVGVTDASQTVFAANCGGSPHCFAINALGTGNVGGAIVNNKIGQISVDLGNKKLWIRGQSTDNWNLTVGADPATGTSGVDISAMTFPIFIGTGSPTNGYSAILITNPAYMTLSAPAGYTPGW